MPDFITSNKGDALPRDYENQMKTSFDWLKDWVSKRTNMKNPQGKPLLTQQEAAKLIDEVNKLRIYEGKHTVELLRKDVSTGKITGISSEDLKPGSSFLREIQETLEGYERLGGRIESNNPAVYINSAQVGRNLDAQGTPQSMAFGALTEMTKGQAAQIGKAQQLSGDMYFPQMLKSEVLASLNVLRYNFNLDPMKQYTEADVAKMRAISDKNIETYDKQCNAALSKNQKPPMQPRQIIPAELDRLSNKEITTLLNNVAMNLNIRPMDGLDAEHNTAATLLADRREMQRNDIKPQQAPTQKVDVRETLRAGRHFG